MAGGLRRHPLRPRRGAAHPRLPACCPALRAAALLGLAVIVLAGCATGGVENDGAEAPPPAANGDDAEPGPPREPLVDDPDGGDDDSRTLRWAIREPGEIVPPLATDADALQVVDALFEGLTVLDADGAPSPGVATTWRSDDDARLWTFFLDSDARFHDGTPVTSADIRASWEAGIRLGAQPPHLRDVIGHDQLAAGEADHLSGLLTPDETTVQVLLSRPRGDFATVVAHPALAPVANAAWHDDPRAYAQDPVGNGEFALAEPWSPGDFLRLHRTDPGVHPRAVDEVVFRVTDEATGYVAFQQGRVDVTTVPAGALDQARAEFGERDPDDDGPGIVQEPTLAVYALGMDLDQPPFDNVTVRRGLSFAVDREAIAESAFEGAATPARTMASPAVPGAPASTCPSCLHVPSSAERIFEHIGVEQMTLWIDEDGGHDEVAARLQADLDEVGVDLRVRRPPFANFVAAVESGAATLYRAGWRADHPTLDDALAPVYHARFADGTMATGNPVGYRDDEVNHLLDEAAAITDPEQRAGRFASAERIALGRDLAVIPLVTLEERLAVGERIDGGFTLDPAGRVDLRDVRLAP